MRSERERGMSGRERERERERDEWERERERDEWGRERERDERERDERSRMQTWTRLLPGLGFRPNCQKARGAVGGTRSGATSADESSNFLIIVLAEYKQGDRTVQKILRTIHTPLLIEAHADTKTN